MTAYFSVTLLTRTTDTLDAMVARAASHGLDGSAARACLTRGDDAAAPFAELALRLQRAYFEETFDALSNALVLRVLDDAALWRGTHADRAAFDALFGADWHADATFEPGIEAAPLAYVVTTRDPAHALELGPDRVPRDEWCELRVWIAARLVPWLPRVDIPAHWDSAAFAGYDAVRDRFMARFPPSAAAAAVWSRRVALFDRPDGESWSAVALAPDGRRAMALDGTAERVLVLDLERGTTLRRWRTRRRGRWLGIPWLAADPLAPRVLCTTANGRVVERDWEGRRGRRVRALEPAGEGAALRYPRFAPTGQLVCFDDLGNAPDGFGPRCVLHDREGLQALRVLAEHATADASSAIRAYAFARRAPVGATGDSAGGVACFALDGARDAWQVSVGGRPVVALALAPDGASVFALDDAGWLVVLDGASGRVVRRAHTHDFQRYALAMCPDGRTLVMASGTVVLFYDVPAGEWVRCWFVPGSTRFETGLDGAGITPDGRLLCVATGGRALDVFALPA